MRISFDVDDTLVCDSATPVERVVPWYRCWQYREPLRAGTQGLMQTLLADGHTLWIYTTSYRPEGYLRGWFRSLGVTLSGVVNQTRHERVVGRRGPSKYPPAFGIELHVDDSPGVEEEGRKHRFDVVVISPADLKWTERVLARVRGG